MRYIVDLFKSMIYISSLLGIYYFHGYHSNEYAGFKQINFNFESVVALLISTVFSSFLIGKKYKKPSDYFLLLYGLIVIVPYSILHSVWGGDYGAFYGLMIVFIPFLCILIICKINFRAPRITVFSESFMTRMILILSFMAVMALLLKRPATASFSLLDTYDRRLEARDVYGSGTFYAYIASIIMNGVLPLLAFVGVMRRRFYLIFSSFLLYVAFFYMYGVKAPIVYIFFAGAFAYSLRKSGDDNNFYDVIYYLLIACLAVAWLEFLFFDYSFLEDYFIRRIFYVGSYIIGAYFELISYNSFSWVSGFSTSDSISMYVGENVIGSPGENANTNTFLYFLAQFGLPGYIFSIVLVGFFLCLLNSLKINNKLFVLFSLLYSMLILEQSATTALLSSGIGLLSIFYYFSKVHGDL